VLYTVTDGLAGVGSRRFQVPIPYAPGHPVVNATPTIDLSTIIPPRCWSCEGSMADGDGLGPEPRPGGLLP